MRSAEGDWSTRTQCVYSDVPQLPFRSPLISSRAPARPAAHLLPGVLRCIPALPEEHRSGVADDP